MNQKNKKEIVMSDQNIKDELNKSVKKRFSFPVKSGLIISLLVIAAVLILIKGIAFAQHLHKSGEGPEGFIIERISEKLDLTASQKTEVDRIKSEIKQKMEANRPDREGMFSEFSEMFKSDKIDKSKIMEEMNRKEIQREEMKSFMIDKLIEFHSILTPEQRSKAVEFMKEMKEKFHGKKDKFRDRQD